MKHTRSSSTHHYKLHYIASMRIIELADAILSSPEWCKLDREYGPQIYHGEIGDVLHIIEIATSTEQIKGVHNAWLFPEPNNPGYTPHKGKEGYVPESWEEED